MTDNSLLYSRNQDEEDAVFRPKRDIPTIFESIKTVRGNNLSVRGNDLLMLIDNRDIFVVPGDDGVFTLPTVEQVCTLFPAFRGGDYLRIGARGDDAVFVFAVDAENETELRDYHQKHHIQAGNPGESDKVMPQLAALRFLMGVMDQQPLAYAVAGVQLNDWYLANRFCGVCGRATALSDASRSMVCTACGQHQFPRLSPAVITAILKEDRILLAHNRRFASSMFSLIAGFVDPGETLEEAVAREAMEEVAIVVDNIRYLGSQCWPFPNSLMVGFVAEWRSGEIRPDGIEIDRAEWFALDDLPELPMGISISRKLIDYVISLSQKV